MISRDLDHKALIDAVNLLCEYAESKIASGWEVHLICRAGESELTLLDPSGEEHEVHSDRDWSTWAEACDVSAASQHDWCASANCAICNERFNQMQSN